MAGVWAFQRILFSFSKFSRFSTIPFIRAMSAFQLVITQSDCGSATIIFRSSENIQIISSVPKGCTAVTCIIGKKVAQILNNFNDENAEPWVIFLIVRLKKYGSVFQWKQDKFCPISVYFYRNRVLLFKRYCFRTVKNHILVDCQQEITLSLF